MNRCKRLKEKFGIRIWAQFGEGGLSVLNTPTLFHINLDFNNNNYP